MILKILTKDFYKKHLAALREKEYTAKFKFYVEDKEGYFNYNKSTGIVLTEGPVNYILKDNSLYFLVPKEDIPDMMRNYPNWSQMLFVDIDRVGAVAIDTVNATIEKDLIKFEQMLGF